MSKVAGGLKSDLSQFRELAAFAQFGSDLDASTQRQLSRGERLMELLKQPQYNPWPLHHQIYLIFAGARGYLDNVDVDKIEQWSREFVRYMDTAYSNLEQELKGGTVWNDAVQDAIKQAVIDFNANWSN
jgi:F-type H+-transporting ATPase subunit alpha